MAATTGNFGLNTSILDTTVLNGVRSTNPSINDTSTGTDSVNLAINISVSDNAQGTDSVSYKNILNLIDKGLEKDSVFIVNISKIKDEKKKITVKNEYLRSTLKQDKNVIKLQNDYMKLFLNQSILTYSSDSLNNGLNSFSLNTVYLNQAKPKQSFGTNQHSVISERTKPKINPDYLRLSVWQ